jgi:hypothetical protein
MSDAREDLIDLITNSIIQIYAGDLERSACEDRHGAFIYTPLDVDNIRDLLTKHWGELVEPPVLDEAFERLTEDGAEHWPKAWCDEDLDEEADRHLRDLDYEDHLIEEREEALAKEQKRLQADKQALIDEANQLARTLRD